MSNLLRVLVFLMSAGREPHQEIAVLLPPPTVPQVDEVVRIFTPY
jgi:hypothetical protein